MWQRASDIAIPNSFGFSKKIYQHISIHARECKRLFADQFYSLEEEKKGRKRKRVYSQMNINEHAFMSKSAFKFCFMGPFHGNNKK